MTLKAVFLDVGNTLLSEVEPRYAIYAEAARRHGRNVSDRAMERVMRTALDEIPRSLKGAFRFSDAWFRAFIHRIFCINLGLAPAVTGEIAEELFARFQDPATFRLFPGARELVAVLRGHGLKVGVISNWSERLPVVLERLGLDGLDVVVCSALEELEKPDPRIFATACERAGVTPAEALHAGDRPEKDGAARQAGLEVVLVDHFGAHLDADLPRVGGLEELARYVTERLP